MEIAEQLVSLHLLVLIGLRYYAVTPLVSSDNLKILNDAYKVLVQNDT